MTFSRLQLTEYLLISWVVFGPQSSTRLKMLLTEGETRPLIAETKGASRNSSGTRKPSWVGFTTSPLIVPKWLFVVSTYCFSRMREFEPRTGRWIFTESTTFESVMGFIIFDKA